MIWLTGITGTVLALVSIACSAILWSSYAVSTLDTVIASFTAAALVLCQYLFFVNAKHHRDSIKHAHTAAVAVLFITSCAATVGWLESRYQANTRAELQEDSSYTTQQTTQQQRLADLANGLSGWRWLLWVLLALLVDLCPMLCFAHVAHSFSPVQRTADTTETTTATPETTQPKPAPALPATAETHPATEHIQARIINGEAPAMRSFIGNEFNGKKLRQGNRFEPTNQTKQEAA